nr:surface protein [Domestic cat hepadnavirus]
MGANQSIPNPLGFFPRHNLDLTDPAGTLGDFDHNPLKDPWPQSSHQSRGAWGPGFVPPHGGLLSSLSFATQGVVSAHPITKPPRKKGRDPTPLTPPVRVTHPQMSPSSWRQKYGYLLLPKTTAAPGPTSPPQTTVAPTASSTSSPPLTIGAPAARMGNITSGPFGFLLGLQVGSFLWTKIQTIGQSADSWWTSLSFPGAIPGCIGQDSQYQTSKHSPTSCPPTCTGFPWMCLRRFIIYLLLLALLLIFSLVLLDWKGLLPVCPFPPGDSQAGNIRCKACIGSAPETPWPPLCCCTVPSDGNCTCWPIPSSWALGSYLWELALARFSWLSSLVVWLQWLGGISPIVWCLLIWMTWFWGLRVWNILSQFMPLLFLLFYHLVYT